ncbi:MAG TPA: ABC transporter substrate-binding protein [Gaiella sp.]|nr:ABC transporter substrate-binding protein [Gaiella sp.]
MSALAVALLVAAVGQSRPNATTGTIKIGWVGDKSGPTVASQIPVLHAMQAYFRLINGQGGIRGNRIEMIEKDDSYSPAKELELVKSVINDDKVVLVTGIGNSSGFASILPVLNQAKVVGLSNQGTLKTVTNPFQPYLMLGNCNYADQGDVALGYMMQRFKLKNLNGVKVGIAGIAVASVQEWNENLQDNVRKLGGQPVVQTLPSAIVNADVAVQAFESEKVRFVLLHHSVAGGIAMLRSMAKYNLTVPISGSFGVTQEIVYESSPYDAAKNFVGTNCATPPLFVKSAKGKLAYATGKRFGYPEAEITQQNWALGWANAMLIVEGLKKVKGAFTPASVKAGLEQVKNLDTGGLTPNMSLDRKCHMAIQQVRPYTYSYSKKQMLPVGTYQQWSKYVTNAYAAPGTCGKKK